MTSSPGTATPILLLGLACLPGAGAIAETRLQAGLALDDDGGSYRSVALDTSPTEVIGLGVELARADDGVDEGTRALRFELRSEQTWTLQLEYLRHGESDSIELDDHAARLVYDAAAWSVWGGVTAGIVRIYPAADADPGSQRFDTDSLGWDLGGAWWSLDDWFVQAGYGRTSYADSLGVLVDDPRSAAVFSSSALGVAAGLEKYHLHLRYGLLLPDATVDATVSRSVSAVDGAGLEVFELGYARRLPGNWDYRFSFGLQTDAGEDIYLASLQFAYTWVD